ncbi:oligosaccharide flippase family protein [Patescibacteria group bacterium]
MLDITQIGKRAVTSVIALTSRTFLLNVINFLGTLALTIFLTREEFGIFVITSTIVDILAYFSDIGLAGALIQKKTKLKKREIEATFTLQEILVLSGISIAFLVSGPIQRFYQLDQAGIWLFYALLIAFFMSSLKTIPSVLLERRLKFEKIIIPQIAETLVFNSLIVSLAWMGYGIKSYIVAVLARAVVGTVIIYILVPWRPRLRFSLKAVKSLFSFGIPYQINSVLAVFKDRVSLLVLGKILGLEALGILGWAEKWSNLALRYFLDATVKVAFPMFSRLQHELDKMKKSLEHFIYFIATLVFPFLAGAYVIMPRIVQVIPKYSKWESGLSTFNLFLISAGVAAVSTFLTNFLMAVGKIKQVVGLMVFWTIMTLSLYPLLALKFGVIGVAMGSIIISLTSVITYLLVRRTVKFKLLINVLPGLVASGIMIVVVKLIDQYLAANVKGLMLMMGLGVIVYLVSLYLINGKKLKDQINTFVKYAKA